MGVACLRRAVWLGMMLMGFAADLPGQGQSKPLLQDVRGQADAGRFAEAENRLHSYLREHGDAAEESYFLAYVLMRDGKAAASLAQYTAAAKLRAPTAEDLKNVALDYALLEDYEDAEVWIKHAQEQDESDAEIEYVAGRIAYERHAYPLALERLGRARALRPQSSKIATNVGLAYEALGETESAVATYRSAVTLMEKEAVKSPQPYLNLAVSLLHKGDTEEPVKLLTMAEAVSPEDGRVQQYLGQAYLATGDRRAAQAHLERAVMLLPKDASVHFLLGKAYHLNGLAERANAEFALSTALRRSGHATAALDATAP